MNIKKNITVATLATLLAVPALNNSHLNKTIHIPSVTAYASSKSSNLNGNYFDGNSSSSLGNHKKPSKLKPLYNHKKHVQNHRHTTEIHHSESHTLIKLIHKMKSMGAKHVNSNELVLKHNGHQFTLTGTNTSILVDGQPVFAAQALALLNKPNTTIKGHKPNHNKSSYKPTLKPNNVRVKKSTSNKLNSQNNSSSHHVQSNNSAQYTSKNNLPQTGESTNKRILALGSASLMASVSLAALSMAKKRKEMATVENNTDDVSTNNDKYSKKNSYNLIMSDTFNSISRGFKNM